MNAIVYHIVSGQAFFTGIGLTISGVLGTLKFSGMAKRLSLLAVIIGLISIAVSSTPIPYWYYVLATIGTLTWSISLFRRQLLKLATTTLVLIWLIAAGLEIPYHFIPKLNAIESHSLTVIGDSVTAGVGGDETSERWPMILTREHELQVQDIAHMGETAASAWKRVQTHHINSPIVLLEIGGNDLLGSTTSGQFARDLDRLLSLLAKPNRQLVMFELPLPPFYHEYGRIQRMLATKYRVHLIPKRVFLSILAGEDSTLDSIHLSQAGHQRMADAVWRTMSSAFPMNEAD